MSDGPAHEQPDPTTPVAATPAGPAARARWFARPLVWIAVVVVLAVARVLVPHSDSGHPGKRDFRCVDNLVQLAEICGAEETAAPRRSQRTGPALLLEWRKSGRISARQESLLVCPRDPGALAPGEFVSTCPNLPGGASRVAPVASGATVVTSPWDDADLDAPAPGLCSYAVRDFARFPLVNGAEGSQVVAACFHHPGRAIVAFGDGSVRFVRFDELGIDDASELTAGPDSKVKSFRELIAPPPRRE